MNPLLSHLPIEKQEELERITRLILKSAKIEMIWLFGSYATGKWVEETTFENGVQLEYKSDYDILVILPFDDVKKHYKIRNGIKNKLENKGLLHTQVSIIYHSLKDINLALLNGSYFFVDLFKEGIELANVSKHTLATPKLLTSAERQAKAQEHFDQWFYSADGFFDVFNYCFNKSDYNLSAFNLHQATERYFHTTLLVFNDYKPKQHDLELLEKESIKLDERFNSVFLKFTEEELRIFSLLRRAYIDSRYKMKAYEITKAELEYLAERVTLLKNLTEEICTDKIKQIGLEKTS